MVLYAAADLIWATRIKATAESLGVVARPARTIEMLEARFADSPVRLVIVDLEAEGAMDLVRAASGRADVVAFGPHVAVEALAAAKAEGAQVMTRGGFDRALADVLARAR